MRHIRCILYLPHLAPPLGRVRQLIRPLGLILAPALVLAVLGCREDAELPTAAESAPTLDVTPARVLAFRQVSAAAAPLASGTRAG
jgi:hypothetical protein